MGYFLSVLPSLAGKSWVWENYDQPTPPSDDDAVLMNQKTCLAMLGLGIAQCITCYTMGKLSSSLKKPTIVHISFVMSAVAIAAALLVTKYYEVRLHNRYTLE